jgi:hypothetical protein
MMDRDQITIREGDRLFGLVALVRDSHYDDIRQSLLASLWDQIQAARVTSPDGSPLRPVSNPYR